MGALEPAGGQALTNAEPCPVVQLQLEGPTVLEAWNANPTTRAMEQLANSHERDVSPTHISFQALLVYHGTRATQARPREGMADIVNGRLFGSVMVN